MTTATLAVVLLLLTPARADDPEASAPSLTVIATDPAPTATLGRTHTFYARFRIDTPFPVTVFLRPYLHGDDVTRVMGTSGEPTLPAGQTTDAAFFFLLAKTPQRVDELRFVVTKAGDRAAQWVFSHPVDLTFDPAYAAQGPPVASWVSDWKLARDARFREAAATASRAGQGTALGLLTLVLIPVLVFILPVAALALPLYGVWKWRGIRRLVAALPLVVLAIKLVTLAADLRHDPTSHNLWPLELLLWELPALGVVLMTWIVDAAAKRR